MICFDLGLVGFFSFARQLYQVPLLLRDKKYISLKLEDTVSLKVELGRAPWVLV
jgi:hypothetical protein